MSGIGRVHSNLTLLFDLYAVIGGAEWERSNKHLEYIFGVLIRRLKVCIHGLKHLSVPFDLLDLFHRPN